MEKKSWIVIAKPGEFGELSEALQDYVIKRLDGEESAGRDVPLRLIRHNKRDARFEMTNPLDNTDITLGLRDRREAKGKTVENPREISFEFSPYKVAPEVVSKKRPKSKETSEKFMHDAHHFPDRLALIVGVPIFLVALGYAIKLISEAP